MLRKLISKITQTFKKGESRPEAKPAAGHRHPKAAPKAGGHSRHERSERPERPDRPERRGGGGRGHRTHEKPAHERTSHGAPREPHTPRATHAPKPLPEVPAMSTAFSALGLGDRLAFAVQEKDYE